MQMTNAPLQRPARQGWLVQGRSLTLLEMQSSRKAMPLSSLQGSGDVPFEACFDSTRHARSYCYDLPGRIREELGVQRDLYSLTSDWRLQCE